VKRHLVFRTRSARSKGVVPFLLLVMTLAAGHFAVAGVLDTAVSVGEMDAPPGAVVATGWVGWSDANDLALSHAVIPGRNGLAQRISTQGTGASAASITTYPSALKHEGPVILSFWYRRPDVSGQPLDAQVIIGSSNKTTYRALLPGSQKWAYAEYYVPAARHGADRLVFRVQNGAVLELDDVGLRPASEAEMATYGPPARDASSPAEEVDLVATDRSWVALGPVFHGIFLQYSSNINVGTMEVPGTETGVAGGWRGWNDRGLPTSVSHSLQPGRDSWLSQRVSTADNGTSAATLTISPALLIDPRGEQPYRLSFWYRMWISDSSGSSGADVTLKPLKSGRQQQLIDLEPSENWRYTELDIPAQGTGQALIFRVRGPGVILDIDDVSLTDASGVAGTAPIVLPESRVSQPEDTTAKLLIHAGRGRFTFVWENYGLIAAVKKFCLPLGVLLAAGLGIALLSFPTATKLFGLAQGFVRWEPAPADMMWLLWDLSGVVNRGILWFRLRQLRQILWPVLLFALGHIVALIHSGFAAESVWYTLITFYGICSCVSVILLVRDQQTLHHLQLGIILAAAANSLIGLLGLLRVEGVSQFFTRHQRLNGFFKDPNVLGPFLLAAFLFVEGYAARLKSRTGSVLMRLCQALLLLGIMQTQSRAAVGTLVVSVIILLCARVIRRGDWRTAWQWAVLLTLAVLITGGILYRYSGLDLSRLVAITDYDVNERFPVQVAGLRLSLAEPWGIGPGMFEHRFNYAAHSLYVRTLVETGWIGAIGLLWLVAVTSVRVWRATSQDDTGHVHVMLAWWGGVLLNSLVIDTIHWRHFWILLGMTWLQILRAEEHPEKRSKVLHAITLAEVGGAQRVVYSLVGATAKCRPTVLVCGPGAELPRWVRSLDTTFPVTICQLPSLRRELSLWWDVRALVDLLRVFRKERPLIVHLHSSKMGVLGAVAARLTGVPFVVYTSHGWPMRSCHGRVRQALYLWLERFALRLTDKVVCVSESERHMAVEWKLCSAEKLTVIPNGVPSGPEGRGYLRTLLGVTESTLLVGCVARLAEPKDPFAFVRLAYETRDVIPNATFVWIGDGPLRASCEQQVAKLNLRDRVRFVGIREDARLLVNDMDVVVLFSQAEAMPLVVMEAMWAGKPIVASAVGGVPQLIEHGLHGFLVSPGSDEAAKSFLVQLATDPALRTRMGQAGLEKARTYMNEFQMTQAYEELYRTLVQK